MSDTAKLEIEGNVYELPIIVGTEGEKAIDITKLRASSGYVAMDPGFGNTGSCTSKITFINGEQGILRHHGIPVDQLVEKSSFTEVAYMLLNNGSGRAIWRVNRILPNRNQSKVNECFFSLLF